MISYRYMKIFLIISLIVINMLLFVGCQKNSITSANESTDLPSEKSIYSVIAFTDATMSIVNNSTTKNGVTVEFSYEGNNKCAYDARYDIEIFIDDVWYKLPWTYDNEIPFNWTAESYPINEDEPRQEEINWVFLYGELISGHYRIIKPVFEFRDGGYSEFYLAAEFIIE